MKFSEEKAAELATKYSIPQATINTWRFRNAIPNKYKENIKTSLQIEYELKQSLRLREILKSEKINVSVVCETAAVENGIINDWVRCKGRIYKEDYVKIRAVLVDIYKSLEEYAKKRKRGGLENKNRLYILRKILNRQEVHWFIVFNRDRLFYNKICNWKDGKQTIFPVGENGKLNGMLLKLHTEIKLDKW